MRNGIIVIRLVLIDFTGWKMARAKVTCMGEVTSLFRFYKCRIDSARHYWPLGGTYTDIWFATFCSTCLNDDTYKMYKIQLGLSSGQLLSFCIISAFQFIDSVLNIAGFFVCFCFGQQRRNTIIVCERE